MKNKTALIIITLGLLIGISVILMGGTKSSSVTTNAKVEQKQNIQIKDGIQYITITAKGGYIPRVTTAKAGVPTKLIVNTKGTYDCSLSLVIKAINYQKILPQTGEEIIDLGVQKPGTPIRGVCGMGMYSFLINFE
ncbi:MAG: cupredoxin domain-containing protein [Candidatus Pacebacteria bacterium]|nr:cupredoxin domain-containing protein [Candidatus Paceibacterota bacterium]